MCLLLGLILLLVLANILLSVYFFKSIAGNIQEFSLTDFNRLHELATNAANINDSVDRIEYPVFYINLDINTERKKFMEDQYKKYNVEYKRIRAIYGKKYNLYGDTLEDGYKFVNTYDINLSELGCTLSHLKAIKYAYDNNYPMVVIMEDDVSLNLMPLWKKSLPEIVRELPSDWKILQLHHLCAYKKGGPVIRSFKECNCYGAAAYLINRAGMKTILDRCYRNGTFYLEGYSDGLADIFIYECVADVYLYNIPLFYTYNASQKMESQLHPTHTPFHISRSSQIINAYVKDVL